MKTALFAHDSTEDDPLHCAFAIAAPALVSGRWMYMPGGRHVITPSHNGKPVQVEVQVGPEAAAALNAQLADINSRSRKRAYFDFDHGDGKASFWPERFEWSETPEPGIYAIGEETASGRAAIEGRDYRGFSPVFFVNDVKAKPARIVCRSGAKPNMGGLVNNPAFAAIKPFFASDASHSSSGNAAGENQKNNAIMTPQELAALQSRIQSLEHDINGLKAKDGTEAASELRAKQAELKAAQAEIATDEAEKKTAELKAKNEQLEAADLSRRKAHAKQFRADMISRGALAAKDEKAGDDVEKNMTENPDVFAPIYSKWAGQPALGGRITPGASATTAQRVEVGAISARDAANAYGEMMAKQRAAATLDEKSLIAKEASLIWAADLRNNEAFLDMPLVAANSLGTVSGTLVTQRTLELLKFQFPILSRITTDFSDEQAKYSQTITTRTRSIPTVGTYNTSTGYAQTDQTGTDVSVTINAHKYVQSTFNANNLASTARNLFGEFAEGNAYAIAKDLVDAVYALILAATYTNTVITSALGDFSRATVIDIGVALNLLGVPQGPSNRTLLLYSTYFGKLAQDAAIVSLAAFQKSGVITDGDLPNVHGFAVVDAPNLPSNSENLVGAAFSHSALVLATRLPNDYTKALPGAAFGNIMVVTNPDSGFSTMQVEYVDHTLGSANQRLAWMRGQAAGQAAALQRLTSA